MSVAKTTARVLIEQPNGYYSQTAPMDRAAARKHAENVAALKGAEVVEDHDGDFVVQFPD